MGLQRAGHNLATEPQQQIIIINTVVKKKSVVVLGVAIIQRKKTPAHLPSVKQKEINPAEVDWPDPPAVCQAAYTWLLFPLIFIILLKAPTHPKFHSGWK